MFAYCGNSPTERNDITGTSWLEDVGEAIANWAENSFGASSAVEYQKKVEREVFADWISWLLTLKIGVKEVLTKSISGNSSKPLSVYAKERCDALWLSSAGIKVNGYFFKDIPKTDTISFGLDNIGYSKAITFGEHTYSCGLVVDITQWKIGLEVADTIKINENLSSISFYNFSITGTGVLMCLAYLWGGSFAPQLVPAK